MARVPVPDGMNVTGVALHRAGTCWNNSIAGGKRRTPPRIPTCFLWIVRLWAYRCQGGTVQWNRCLAEPGRWFGRVDGDIAMMGVSRRVFFRPQPGDECDDDPWRERVEAGGSRDWHPSRSDIAAWSVLSLGLLVIGLMLFTGVWSARWGDGVAGWCCRRRSISAAESGIS
jgi:hypothetical protein